MEEKKEGKNLLGKLKDAAEDNESQIQILSTFVRLGVVVWAGFIITLNYVELPVDKPKVANAPVNTLATNVISPLDPFLIIGNST